MDYLVNTIIGTASGVLAAIIYLRWYLNQRRPIIEVSPYICKMEIDNQLNYLFKLVNKTDFDLFDVKFEATFFKPVGHNGKNLQSKDIALKDDYLLHLSKKDDADIYNLHAKWIRTEEDIEARWTDESSFIRLTITSKHSLSGLSQVCVKDYDSKRWITNKIYNSGDDLTVK